MSQTNKYCALLVAGVVACAGSSTAYSKNLQEFYSLAKSSDPSFHIADIEREAAKERREQAKSAFRPSASGQASYTESRDMEFDDGGNSSGYTLSLDYQLYNKSRGISLTQTERSIEKADADYRSAEQNLMLNVAQLYFGVLSAIDDLVFSKVSKQAIRKQLEQSQQRFDVGLIAITDVQEAQAGYDLAVANELQAKNALDTAYEKLREVVGAYHQDLDTLRNEISLARPDPENIETWVEHALENSPSLAAAQYDVELAQQNIDLQRAGHHPIVGVSAQHSYNDQDAGMLRSHGFNNSLSLSLQLPFDLSGRVRAQTREAQVTYTQALDVLEQRRRQIQRSVREAYLNVLSDISRVTALKQAVVSNQTAYRATVTGFEVGTRTSVDVLTARQNLLGAQRNYASARYGYILNSLSLKQAAGLLTDEELSKLSQWLTPVNADQDSQSIVDAQMQMWEQSLETESETE